MNKTVYFVRHGEGHHNANNLYSLPHFELTDKGQNEALAAGERLKHLPIDLMVVSTYKRTRQTAEMIKKVIGEKETVFSDLAVEIKRPSEIAGTRIDLPENLEIRKLLDEKAHDPDWRYSDEENFTDLKNRGMKFLEYLEDLPQSHIAVISHSVFIKMLILLIITGDELTPGIFQNSYKGMKFATSGLTVCSYKEGLWSLDTWNDQAHLAENPSDPKGE
jgi:broad specificity phosphatase PhoE